MAHEHKARHDAPYRDPHQSVIVHPGPASRAPRALVSALGWGAKLLAPGLQARRARERMVEEQIVARQIRDPRVIQAMAEVPREAFVPPELRELAYEDSALPIGHDQSISQPYIVALTLEALALRGDETVLDIGTGSGYAAALLSRLARRVYSLERLPQLAHEARERLTRLGYPVQVHCSDGTLGWPERAPFGAIAVAAAGPIVPPALVAQLELGGRLVMPLEQDGTQLLVEVRRLGADTFHTEPLQEVRFVPLIGAQGQRSEGPS